MVYLNFNSLVVNLLQGVVNLLQGVVNLLQGVVNLLQGVVTGLQSYWLLCKLHLHLNVCECLCSCSLKTNVFYLSLIYYLSRRISQKTKNIYLLISTVCYCKFSAIDNLEQLNESPLPFYQILTSLEENLIPLNNRKTWWYFAYITKSLNTIFPELSYSVYRFPILR